MPRRPPEAPRPCARKGLWGERTRVCQNRRPCTFRNKNWKLEMYAESSPMMATVHRRTSTSGRMRDFHVTPSRAWGGTELGE